MMLNDKIIPLSKQRIAEAKYQSVLKPTSTNLTNLVAVEQQTAMIVHDMRSPLCVILNVLQAYQNMPLDQLEKTRLTLALEEAQRLKRMTEEILAHSRSSYQQKSLSSEIRLLDLIHETIHLVTNSTISSDKQISFMPDGWEIIVKGDRDKLKQVFINLLMNACEAVSSADVITVHTQIDAYKQHILIQIHNRGNLIPSDLIPMLGHQQITTKSSGHGLGLMIVKEIIDAHAGSLEIQSSEGKGTTVCVRLPIVQFVNQSYIVPEKVESSPTISKCEIEILQLLVDGYTNSEIAKSLSISKNTVKTHVCSLMNKLGADRRTQVVVKALRLGIIK
jgi:signal transduction histidine kinase/DNA-binding CsgD family transcriptional regulator